MPSNIYLKIDKVKGSSKQADFKGQIEVYCLTQAIADELGGILHRAELLAGD